MIRFDRRKFRRSANEILDDIQDGEIRSKSWTWLAAGAILGFMSSCFSIHKKSGEPILGRFKNFTKKEIDL